MVIFLIQHLGKAFFLIYLFIYLFHVQIYQYRLPDFFFFRLPDFYILSMGNYNQLLSLFILIFKLSQIWPVPFFNAFLIVVIKT